MEAYVKDVLPSRSASSAETGSLICRAVRGAAELTAHHRIRHAVFVVEQELFEVSDLDAHDVADSTIHVLGLVAGVPAGTVRLYPIGPSPTGPSPIDGALWQGDRLAVLSEHRHAGIGGPLVKHAVHTAGLLGGSRMLAQVQVPNVRFFEYLGWSRVGSPAHYVGVAHQQMSIALR
jgi:putative N-acetyltransferase (TIGR04045 family)